jgi:Ca2+-binding EF-hand superfamily protein
MLKTSLTKPQLIIAVTVLAVGATALIATELSARPGPGGDPMTFETLDADGDGKITAADLEALKTERFAAIDADGDGAVTLDEFKAAAATRAEERAEEIFSRLDADGDGTLGRDVLEQRQGRGGAMGERMISRLDSDGDDAVSPEEFEAIKERGRGGRHGRMKRGDH